MSSTKTIATRLTRYSSLASKESGKNMIDSNFWKLFNVHSLNRVVDRNYWQILLAAERSSLKILVSLVSVRVKSLRVFASA